jgi:ParB family chromosome partitioning protein
MPLKTTEVAKPTTVIDAEVMLNEKITNIQNLVNITQDGNFIIVKPKQFLANTTWRDVNEAIRQLGGAWIGKGKESHWEMLIEEGATKPAKKCNRCGTQTFTPTVYEGTILCGKCASGIKASLEQEVPKTDVLVKDVKKSLEEDKQSIKEPKPITFHPFQMLPVEAILSMPFQIRQTKEIDQELADSIRQVGVVEPIIVRPKESGKFECVAGSRRLSHAKEVGLDQIPCVIRILTDQQAYEIQLIENIHRKDLTDIEKARALDYFIKQSGCTQEAMAKKIGKSQPWVANHLRMLQLEKDNIISREIMEKVPETVSREILSAPVEKRQEIAEKVAEHIEETGKPLSIKEIHELAEPQNTIQTPSLKEEPQDIAEVKCTICQKEFFFTHNSDGSHVLKSIRRENA